MSLTSLLSAYLLGGITFLPLLLITVFTAAWFALPQIQNESKEAARDGISDEKVDLKGKDVAQEDGFSADGAANATFAVLRSYNFQSALSTLSAKANTGSHGGVDGQTELGTQESMSVYQSMYRSVFDRSKTALNRNSLAEEDEPATGVPARLKPTAPTGSMYHIVLRHGHLMLYDSPAELEVRHVISMAHHSVSLTDGDGDDENMLDADLFIKRTAILLKPHLPNANSDTPKGAIPQPKPFYLFSSNCSEKEDFYHALVAAQTESPTPQPLDSSCSIKLQSSIHSNSLTPETRALNALTNRIFLALHRTPFLEDLVRDKIEKKISRVAKPAFISYVNVQSIDLGDAGPILSNPRLKDIHISGDMVLSMDVKYTGGVKVVISAVAKLDLGQRFKVRTVDLVLAGSLQRLQGRMLVRVKPPPSNRIWFCFENLPDMEIKVEPIVSSRHITYNWILRQIENRIREVFAETLVKPNWDDVPFFDTHGQYYRGGIWQRDSEAREERRPDSGDPTAKDMLAAKTEKTMSMPNLPKSPDVSAMSSGAQTPVSLEEPASEQIQGLKRRSATSTTFLPSQASQIATEKATSISKGVRSPSFTSASPSAPSVAIDGSNVDAVRGGEMPQPAKRWIGRSAPSANKRDAVDAIREVKDRTTPREETTPRSPSINASTVLADGGDEDDPALLTTNPSELDAERRGSGASRSSGNSLHPNTSDTALPLPRTPSRESFARTDTNSSAQSSQTSQTRTKALFAATAAATSAARQWTLNAVANKNKGAPLFRPPSSHKPGPQEPVGRGQPLPPIGQPLPGPKTSLWGGSAFAGGSVKRKPVLPPRQSTYEQSLKEGEKGEDAKRSDSTAQLSDIASMRSEEQTNEVEEDEFGPWRENFGEEVDEPGDKRAEGTESPKIGLNVDERESSRSAVNDGQGASSPRRKAPPPPLPTRRKRVPDLPKRPHERGVAQSEGRAENAATNEQSDPFTDDSTLSAPSQKSDEHNIASIPAPVIDPEAEKRGTLELEEGDGIHIIDAPAEDSGDNGRSKNPTEKASGAKHATVEEVPDSEEPSGIDAPKAEEGR
ncbi:hypothetical protein Q7P37_006407 [Cladosporium fusiforme]